MKRWIETPDGELFSIDHIVRIKKVKECNSGYSFSLTVANVSTGLNSNLDIECKYETQGEATRARIRLRNQLNEQAESEKEIIISI